MKRLNLVINGKGGVGKSFFAVNLVQFLKDHSIHHIAIDNDDENSTLKRYHPDALFVDLGQRRQLDQIFETLAQTDLLVVDCRAASTEVFLEYFEEINLPALLKAIETALTLVIPINHEKDSVDQVQRLVDHLGAVTSYLIVRNAMHSESFTLFELAEIRARLMKELGGKEITMLRLQDWLVESLSAHDITITQAVRHPAFGLLDRQRLQLWQRRLYAQIDSVRDLLLPVP